LNTALPADIEQDIIGQAQGLETFYSPITSCRVLVEAPARHHRKGCLFHIRIDLTVPEGEIVVNRAPTLYPAQRDIRDERGRKESETRSERKHLKVAVREAFHAARRRLQDHARRRRADVKVHQPAPLAIVTKLFPRKGCGYIETADGREIYFHANSVLNNRFQSLTLGSKVRFAEERGEKGPQASTIRLIKAEAATALQPSRLRKPNRTTA
jgi:cold shock CspA family protein